jgi:general secretion pathway protein M
MAIKLNKREQISVAAAGAAVVIFLLLQFLVFPFMDKSDRLTRTIATRQQELTQITAMQIQYLETADKADAMQRRLKTRRRGFTLFSFLETLAGQTGVKTQIAYMKPSNTLVKDTNYRISSVEMKLQDVTMPQLLAYLHGIETSRDMISIKRLSISKGEKNKDLLNTVFQVETLEM